MEGTAKPDYARCVDLVTTTAIREMQLPALIPVAVPIVVGLHLATRRWAGCWWARS